MPPKKAAPAGKGKGAAGGNDEGKDKKAGTGSTIKVKYMKHNKCIFRL